MLRSTLAFLVLSTLSAGPARAGTLSTSPVLMQNGQGVMCLVTNLGTKTVRDVAVELIEWEPPLAGTVVGSTAPADLAPLDAVQTTDLVTELMPVLAACRFTFKGSGKGLRASGSVLDGGTDLLDSQPAR
jgi:hypothetical protein